MSTNFDGDKALVAAVLNGNRLALHQLIDQHQRLVTTMIHRIIDNPMDREELCQDIFLKVYDKLDEFKFQSKLSTWIATIAYRAALNHLNKKKVDFSELDNIAYQMGIENDKAEVDDFTAFVHKLIDQLPIQYRNVLTLYYVEGFSYPEIVEITNMPEGTVKNYLYRAKEKLRNLTEPYLNTELEGYGPRK
jgi:RNA polymerase sigma factor (sigma-70 family)